MAFAEDDPLAEVYNDLTLRAIDGDTTAQVRLEAGLAHRSGAVEVVPNRVSAGRNHLAGTAMALAAVTGLRQALDDDLGDEPAIDIIEQVPTGDRTQAVEVRFVPQDPHASVAIVRPWLLKNTAARTP